VKFTGTRTTTWRNPIGRGLWDCYCGGCKTAPHWLPRRPLSSRPITDDTLRAFHEPIVSFLSLLFFLTFVLPSWWNKRMYWYWSDPLINVLLPLEHSKFFLGRSETSIHARQSDVTMTFIYIFQDVCRTKSLCKIGLRPSTWIQAEDGDSIYARYLCLMVNNVIIIDKVILLSVLLAILFWMDRSSGSKALHWHLERCSGAKVDRFMAQSRSCNTLLVLRSLGSVSESSTCSELQTYRPAIVRCINPHFRYIRLHYMLTLLSVRRIAYQRCHMTFRCQSIFYTAAFLVRLFCCVTDPQQYLRYT